MVGGQVASRIATRGVTLGVQHLRRGYVDVLPTGTAEAVALHFKGAGHESGFYLYVAVILAVGLLVSLMMRDTRRTSLIHED